MVDKLGNRPAVAALRPLSSAAAPTAPAAQPAAPASKGWTPKASPARASFLGGFEQQVAGKLGLTAYAPLQPPPVLKRPVVMLPGLTLGASSFDPLAKQLATNPKNGPVATFDAADGKFHAGGKDGPVMSDADVAKTKLFEMEYRDAKGAPTDKAPQVAQMLREVKRATGSDLDVVTHSAGGDDFRQYLNTRQGADAAVQINRTVMIGPVSHGTVMGNIGGVAGGLIGVQKAGAELAIGSPEVKQLDATWGQQRAQIAGAVTVIGISGAPTAGPGGIQTGDGFVQTDDISLDGASTVILKGADPTPIAHLKEVGYSGVINEVGKALG